MGIEKAEIKIGVAREVGRQYASMSKGLDDELRRLEGEVRAYQSIMKTFESVFVRVDGNLSEGAYDKVGEPLLVAKAAKTALQQALKGIDNLKDSAEARKLQTVGRLDGLVKASEVVEKMARSEQSKIEASLNALDLGEGEPGDKGVVAEDSGSVPMQMPRVTKTAKSRPLGVRPEKNIASKRRSQSPPRKKNTAQPKEEKPVGGIANLHHELPVEMLKQAAVGASTLIKSGGGPKKTSAKKKATVRKKVSKK